MRLLAADKIQALLCNIFVAAGTPHDIAATVASSLTQASLKGVDSHGIMRVSLYVDQILSGEIKPSGRPTILKDTNTLTVVTGNWGFGIYALDYAVKIAVEKAKAQHIAIVGLVNCTHTGRLGQFAEGAAKENILTIITGGGRRGGAGVSVAPFGGSKPAFATNPYAFGMPGGRYGPLVADFATSSVAEGKLQVYRDKHDPVPLGWIVDKEGKPTTNVEDYYNGGMLLPAAGHKGYSLALVAEFLTAFLLGRPQHRSFWLHWCVIAVDVAAFRPLQDYTRDAEIFLEHLRNIPPAPGYDAVLLPGEPETQAEQKRKAEGIPVPEETWEKIKKTASRVNVAISI